MAQLNFDANEVQPLEAFEAIPAGEYEAVITDSEMKPNKAGTGTFLELKTEIVSGDCAGRKLMARLNLNNPSTKAVEMARRELSAICHAVGVLRPADSSELHNRPPLMKVRLVKREDGTASNELTPLQQKWSDEHRLLQYDLMFGKGYALSRMGLESITEGAD